MTGVQTCALPISSEFELPSHVQGDVDRALAGPARAVVLMDVEPGGIQATKNLGFAGKQLIRRCVLELRLICRRPLRIGGMWLDCSDTSDVSQLEANDAMVVYIPQGRGADAAIVAHPSSRDIGK